MTPSTFDKIAKPIKEALQEEYQRGWNDAVASILAAAQKGAPESPAISATPEMVPHPERNYDKPIILMVEEIVNEKPGLRGMEVVREIIARDPKINSDVADRTGRTSLSRLQRRGKIRKSANRWFPAATKNVVLGILDEVVSDAQHGEEGVTNE